MSEPRDEDRTTLCPDCRGRGMIRLPGEWSNETCPTCDGHGYVTADVTARIREQERR